MSSSCSKGLISEEDWWLIVKVHQLVLFVISVAWNKINLVESLFLVSLTKPFISDVTAVSVTINESILLSPTLEDESMYNLLEVFKLVWFNLNLPSPGSAAEL